MRPLSQTLISTKIIYHSKGTNDLPYPKDHFADTLYMVSPTHSTVWTHRHMFIVGIPVLKRIRAHLWDLDPIVEIRDFYYHDTIGWILDRSCDNLDYEKRWYPELYNLWNHAYKI